MNQHDDCGGCNDDEIDCQKCSIDFFRWPYRPVHNGSPHYPRRRCWGSMAEIRLMRACDGLVQTFCRRCLSATPDHGRTHFEFTQSIIDPVSEIRRIGMLNDEISKS